MSLWFIHPADAEVGRYRVDSSRRGHTVRRRFGWTGALALAVGVLAALGAGELAAQTQDVHTRDTWWLPDNFAAHGGKVDALFTFIFVITMAALVGVQGTLVYFLVKYRHREGRKATFIHGHHKAEMIWTITPGVLLVLITILSTRTWAEIRFARPDPDKDDITEVEVLAQQFQWNVRYPGRDGKFGTLDDIGTFDDPPDRPQEIADVHAPVHKPVRVHLMSKDVLHSFFIPNMRQKLDAVPGMRGELWFTPTDVGRYEIACAELCGPQHYTMRGVLIVHTQEEYDAWAKKYYEDYVKPILEEYGALEEEPAEEMEEDGEEKPAEAEEEKPEEDTATNEAPDDSDLAEGAPANSIVGRVVYDGKPPARLPINAVANNRDCAKMHPQPPLDEEWVVGKDGGVRDVLVRIKEGLPAGKTWNVPAEPVVLDQQGCQYKPHVFGVMIGQGVIIRNSDPTAHNVHAFSEKNKAFNESQPKKNMEKAVTFDKPETFPIKCDVHGWMQSWCSVVEHPFFATTDETGKFVIQNVPPGAYELELWHPSGATETMKVEHKDGETSVAGRVAIKAGRARGR